MHKFISIQHFHFISNYSFSIISIAIKLHLIAMSLHKLSLKSLVMDFVLFKLYKILMKKAHVVPAALSNRRSISIAQKSTQKRWVFRSWSWKSYSNDSHVIIFRFFLILFFYWKTYSIIQLLWKWTGKNIRSCLTLLNIYEIN